MNMFGAGVDLIYVKSGRKTADWRVGDGQKRFRSETRCACVWRGL